MIKLKRRLLLTIIFILITSCSSPRDAEDDSKVTYERQSSTSNPDAEEVLKLNKDADIFMFNGLIYTTNIDWIEELELTKDKQIGEITKRNTSNSNFENGMANKLPAGAKIFSVKERGNILIAQYEDREVKYLALVEG